MSDDTRGFIDPILGDGRPLLLCLAGALVFSGGFALFLAATGDFLPQDTHYLGMTAGELCEVASCRIVDFMIHDRVAFGGTLVGLGVLYVWLTAFPLAGGEPWAWWAWLVSATVGFSSFLAYLGYGYLDTWHGLGTLLMVPVFIAGMVRSRRLLGTSFVFGELARPAGGVDLTNAGGWGRVVLLVGAAATALGGVAIMWVGVTETFVPEDLDFIGLSAAQLQAVNPRLIPLIAHDRAGFGGGVLTLGLTTFMCLWCARPSRHLHQAIAVAGAASLAAALGVHGVVGYTDFVHLVPAVGAAVMLVFGLVLVGTRLAPGRR